MVYHIAFYNAVILVGQYPLGGIINRLVKAVLAQYAYVLRSFILPLPSQNPP